MIVDSAILELMAKDWRALLSWSSAPELSALLSLSTSKLSSPKNSSRVAQ
jgi:hypothetical protein